jgi:phosphopantothenoylcysteine decarboxylase/phosphopantothenate--cysteine ligase
MALIALGVTGGVGAYKAVEVCRGLQKRGHDVVAVMTRSAARFVGPVTFEAITRRQVITSQWRPGMNADIEHIAIADGIALLLVAPCTANVIGKFANGIADDFLTVALSGDEGAGADCAGDEREHAGARSGAAQSADADGARRAFRRAWRGVSRLRVDREGKTGRTCRDRRGCGGHRRAAGIVTEGTRVVVTAGPTYEDIDPVRYVGNRSSGRMGFALAAEARRRGAEVTLIAGPTTVYTAQRGRDDRGSECRGHA